MSRVKELRQSVMSSLIATYLDMKPESLRLQYSTGASIDQIVSKRGKTLEDLQAYIRYHYPRRLRLHM